MAQFFRHQDDFYLWIGLAITGAVTFYRARQHLYTVKEAARVTKNEEPQQDIIGQHTEDAISVDTLGELYNSPNYDIRSAATRIIVERVVRNNNLSLLFHNAKSKDPSVRDKALASLHFLSTSCQGPIQESVMTPQTFRLVISILVSFLPLNATRPHTPHTDWKYRTTPERDALSILHTFINEKTKELLQAGLVERWIAKYPFGGPPDPSQSKSDSEARKRKIVAQLKKGSTDDEAMGAILSVLDYHPEGRRQLRKYGLLGSESREEGGTWVVSARALAEVGLDGGSVNGEGSALPRERGEESQEEVALRRRRRQAMVISERGEPLSRDSIIESVETRDE